VHNGTHPDNVIFTSIHTDSLYNENMRGAMIYIPGARLRRDQEVRTDSIYKQYEEGRSYNVFNSVPAELRRDEAMSRNFANILLHELGERRIKRHDMGEPIRSQIRRSRSQTYVPAVLRNNKIPTKVLIETANLNNATDRTRLADPWWREQLAKAYVESLKIYYKTASGVRTASAD
jgi:N-acetylmuramoyl-L-alanine amidase